MAQAGEKKLRLSKAADFENIVIEWNPSHHASPEAVYTSSVTEKRRRHFAQFFTPPKIAAMMAKWISHKAPRRILEPSVGTGVLVRAAGEVLSGAHVICIDADQSPLHLARKSAPENLTCEFVHADFLTYDFKEKFDAILANPPYLRHHDISYDIDIHAEIGRRNRVAVSKACNLYVLFILEICRLLSPDGRAAVLVPADWLNANSASCLRQFLLSTRLLKQLLYFDEDGHHFDGALTTSVILLLENDGVRLDELNITRYSSEMQEIAQTVVAWEELRIRPKWNNVLLGRSTERHGGLVNLGSLSTTMRGLATGANDFFFLTADEMAQRGISSQSTLPCIGNAKDVPGLIFTDDDLQAVCNNGGRTRLVNFGSRLTECEQAYVRHGEQQGYHQRYLLARRRPWYKAEKRAPAPIWAASFGRGRIRFIWNQTDTLNLTTFHCVYPQDLSLAQTGALVCLLNSAPIQRRFADHLRVLGGGLLKFQPNDLLSIDVPDVRKLSSGTIATLNGFLVQIDKEMRMTKETQDAALSSHEELNKYVDTLVLSFAQDNVPPASAGPQQQLALTDLET